MSKVYFKYTTLGFKPIFSTQDNVLYRNRKYLIEQSATDPTDFIAICLKKTCTGIRPSTSSAPSYTWRVSVGSSGGGGGEIMSVGNSDASLMSLNSDSGISPMAIVGTTNSIEFESKNITAADISNMKYLTFVTLSSTSGSATGTFSASVGTTHNGIAGISHTVHNNQTTKFDLSDFSFPISFYVKVTARVSSSNKSGSASMTIKATLSNS